VEMRAGGTLGVLRRAKMLDDLEVDMRGC
jgi:hypothetical protein